jgi:hypothetical protein
MNSGESTPQNALFVYVNDNSGTFWVYDGSQFLRFYWNQRVARFIRAQAYLPACAQGTFILFKEADRRLLEEESARHNLSLPFFDNPDECIEFELLAKHEQFIFDRTYPAGFFCVNNDMQQKNEDE